MPDITQRRDGVSFRRFEYDDEIVVAGDLGPGVDASVDVVDDTAIVVVEGADGEQAQREIDLPSGDAQAFITNGVVTIEVPR